MRSVWAWVAAGALIVVVVVAGVSVVSSNDKTEPARDPGLSMMGSSASVDSEYDYLAQMVAHHEEAITAAGQLARSERPQMRALGARIVNSQTAQVRQMKQWIHRWYPGRPTAAQDYVSEMRDLSGLSGDRLDRAFLADMIPHHMMAVMMSERFLAQADHAHSVVRRLAGTISRQQRVEIALMERWSRAWFGTGSGTGPMMDHMMGQLAGS